MGNTTRPQLPQYVEGACDLRDYLVIDSKANKARMEEF